MRQRERQNYVKPGLRAGLAAGVMALLAGCASTGDDGYTAPDIAVGPQIEDLIRDDIANRLGPADTGRLESATVEALEGPLGAGEVKWVGLGGASGAVQAGPIFVDGVENTRGGPLQAPLELDTSTRLEPRQEDFRTDTNVNVRLGPGTDFAKVDRIDAGGIVRAVGVTTDGDWLLVARDGRVLGYMFAELLTATGTGEMMLAGGQARAPRICRLFRQSLTYRDGGDTTWRGVACRARENQWVVDPGLSA